MTNLEAAYGQHLRRVEDGAYVIKVNLERVLEFLNAPHHLGLEGTGAHPPGFSPYEAALLTPGGEIIIGVFDVEPVVMAGGSRSGRL